MKSVLVEELERISLSRKEVLVMEKIAKDFISSLKDKGVKAFVGGSLAKGTLVRKEGAQDVDVFVVFDYGEEVLRLEKVLGRMKLPGKLRKVHGSRDYFQIDCGDILLEVVPVVKNDDPELAENVTDVSLRHVKYVRDRVKVAGGRLKGVNIADEIRLAKVFCRANRCYGAESYVHGFSGYSLEVLVIYFGGFVKFLKGVQKKRVIDPLKYFRNERNVLEELNASKLQGPIVLVDPTFKYRNICAGLGFETFGKFVDAANAFLKNPSLEFFDRKGVDVEGMKKAKGTFVEIDLKTDRQEGDIAGTKMRKFLDFFASELVRKQQKVLRKEFDYSGFGKKAKGYLVVEEKNEIDVRGPSVGLEVAAKAFKKAKGKVFAKKGFWYFKDRVSIEEIFNLVRKVGGEMGVSGKLV